MYMDNLLLTSAVIAASVGAVANLIVCFVNLFSVKFKTKYDINKEKIIEDHKKRTRVLEEIHNLIVNMENLGENALCYLFLNPQEKEERYILNLKEARDSIIWIDKQIDILSWYIDSSIRGLIKQLLSYSKVQVIKLDADSSYRISEEFSEDIKNIRQKGNNIIELLSKYK